MDKKYTTKQITQWKLKAEKWDKLDKEISKFYVDSKGNPIEGDDDDMGLISIGEIAATALGYL